MLVAKASLSLDLVTPFSKSANRIVGSAGETFSTWQFVGLALFISFLSAAYMVLFQKNRTNAARKLVISILSVVILTILLSATAQGRAADLDYERKIAEAESSIIATKIPGDVLEKSLQTARERVPPPNKPFLSAGWILDTGTLLATSIGSSITETSQLLNLSGSELIRTEKNISPSPLDCEHYIEELERRSDAVAETENLTFGTKELARGISALWLMTVYRTSAYAQWGESDLAPSVFCRNLEAKTRTPPEEQHEITVDAAAGPNCNMEYNSETNTWRWTKLTNPNPGAVTAGRNTQVTTKVDYPECEDPEDHWLGDQAPAILGTDAKGTRWAPPDEIPTLEEKINFWKNGTSEEEGCPDFTNYTNYSFSEDREYLKAECNVWGYIHGTLTSITKNISPDNFKTPEGSGDSLDTNEADEWRICIYQTHEFDSWRHPSPSCFGGGTATIGVGGEGRVELLGKDIYGVIMWDTLLSYMCGIEGDINFSYLSHQIKLDFSDTDIRSLGSILSENDLLQYFKCLSEIEREYGSQTQSVVDNCYSIPNSYVGTRNIDGKPDINLATYSYHYRGSNNEKDYYENIIMVQQNDYKNNEHKEQESFSPAFRPLIYKIRIPHWMNSVINSANTNFNKAKQDYSKILLIDQFDKRSDIAIEDKAIIGTFKYTCALEGMSSGLRDLTYGQLGDDLSLSSMSGITLENRYMNLLATGVLHGVAVAAAKKADIDGLFKEQRLIPGIGLGSERIATQPEPEKDNEAIFLVNSYEQAFEPEISAAEQGVGSEIDPDIRLTGRVGGILNEPGDMTPSVSQQYRTGVNYHHTVRLSNIWSLCVPKVVVDENGVPVEGSNLRGNLKYYAEQYKKAANEDVDYEFSDFYGEFKEDSVDPTLEMWKIRDEFGLIVPLRVSKVSEGGTYDEVQNKIVNDWMSPSPNYHVCAAAWTNIVVGGRLGTEIEKCRSSGFPLIGAFYAHLCTGFRAALSSIGAGPRKLVRNDTTDVLPGGAGMFELHQDQIYDRLQTGAEIDKDAADWMRQANSRSGPRTRAAVGSITSLIAGVGIFVLVFAILILVLVSQMILVIGLSLLPLILALGVLPFDSTQKFVGKIWIYLGMAFLAKTAVVFFLSVVVLMLWVLSTISDTLVGVVGQSLFNILFVALASLFFVKMGFTLVRSAKAASQLPEKAISKMREQKEKFSRAGQEWFGSDANTEELEKAEKKKAKLEDRKSKLQAKTGDKRWKKSGDRASRVGQDLRPSNSNKPKPHSS